MPPATSRYTLAGCVRQGLWTARDGVVHRAARHGVPLLACSHGPDADRCHGAALRARAADLADGAVAASAPGVGPRAARLATVAAVADLPRRCRPPGHVARRVGRGRAVGNGGAYDRRRRSPALNGRAMTPRPPAGPVSQEARPLSGSVRGAPTAADATRRRMSCGALWSPMRSCGGLSEAWRASASRGAACRHGRARGPLWHGPSGASFRLEARRNLRRRARHAPRDPLLRRRSAFLESTSAGVHAPPSCGPRALAAGRPCRCLPPRRGTGRPALAARSAPHSAADAPTDPPRPSGAAVAEAARGAPVAPRCAGAGPPRRRP